MSDLSIDITTCTACGKRFAFGEEAHLEVWMYPGGVELVDGLVLQRARIVHASGCPGNGTDAS